MQWKLESRKGVSTSIYCWYSLHTLKVVLNSVCFQVSFGRDVNFFCFQMGYIFSIATQMEVSCDFPDFRNCYICTLFMASDKKPMHRKKAGNFLSQKNSYCKKFSQDIDFLLFFHAYENAEMCFCCHRGRIRSFNKVTRWTSCRTRPEIKRKVLRISRETFRKACNLRPMLIP